MNFRKVDSTVLKMPTPVLLLTAHRKKRAPFVYGHTGKFSNYFLIRSKSILKPSWLTSSVIITVLLMEAMLMFIRYWIIHICINSCWDLDSSLG